MELKAPEIIIGAVIVYLLMQRKPESEIPPEEEAAPAEELEIEEKVVRPLIPPGFVTGIEGSPTGPPSVPSMSPALRRKLLRITDP